MPKPLLDSVIACPACRTALARTEEGASCAACSTGYALSGTTLDLLPAGMTAAPPAHPQQRYNPFIVNTFFPDEDDCLMLEIGSGDRAEVRENVITMDVGPGKNVDALGDAHRLPFLDDSFDFVFSLSVLEHLRQPFEAAKEMLRVLKPGGRVLCDTNFIFPYHSYPNHYFNFSVHGLREVFADFEAIDVGVPPYGTPGFAVVSVLEKFASLVTDVPGERGLKTVLPGNERAMKQWMVQALEDIAEVAGIDGLRKMMVPMLSQMGVDPKEWAAVVKDERPEVHDFILDVLRENPAPPIPDELRGDPRAAIRALLHLPWKAWDKLLKKDDAHMISASVFFHGRKA